MKIALLKRRSCCAKISTLLLATCSQPINISPVHYDQYRYSSINTGINRGLRASRVDTKRQPGSRWRKQQDYASHDRSAIKPRPGDASRSQIETPERPVAFKARAARRNEIDIGRNKQLRRSQTDISKPLGEFPAKHTQYKEESDIPYDEASTAGVPFTTAASTFIFGSRPALAALRANRRKLYNLYIGGHPTKDKLKYETVIDVAKTRNLKCQWKTKSFINRINDAAGFSKEGPAIDDGVCIEVSPLPQRPILSLKDFSRRSSTFNVQVAYQSREDADVNGTSTIVNYAGSDWRAPCLIWLDGVVDAQNVGAILRSALYFGIDGVILSSRATAGISPGVLKASAGAAEYLPILKVQDQKTFLERSRDNGWAFYATVAPEPREGHRSRRRGFKPIALQSIVETPVARTPSVIVFGNEDEGLSAPLVRAMDQRISISGISQAAGEAHVDSLNVSVACAIFCEKFLSKPRPAREEGNLAPFRLVTRLG